MIGYSSFISHEWSLIATQTPWSHVARPFPAVSSVQGIYRLQYNCPHSRGSQALVVLESPALCGQKFLDRTPYFVCFNLELGVG